MGTKAASALTALIFLGLTGMTAFDVYTLMNETEDWQKKKRLADMELADTRKKADQLPGNIEKISDIVSLYKTFDVQQFKPLPFMKRLSNSLHGAMTVDSIEWRLTSSLEVTSSADPRKITADVNLRLVNPPDPIEEQKAAWQQSLTYIQDEFSKDFDIKKSGIPGEIGEDQTFQTSFGGNGASPQQAVERKQTVNVVLTNPKAKEPPKQ